MASVPRPHTRSRQLVSVGEARVAGVLGFVAAAALPLALLHKTIAALAADFRIDFAYLLTGWSGYSLIAAALVRFAPVVASIGRPPDSRLYPRRRGAFLGWGASLYLLGMALASQVAAIAATR